MLLTGDAYDVINVDDRGDINWGILPGGGGLSNCSFTMLIFKLYVNHIEFSAKV